jgi:hypothetical protein
VHTTSGFIDHAKSQSGRQALGNVKMKLSGRYSPQATLIALQFILRRKEHDEVISGCSEIFDQSSAIFQSVLHHINKMHQSPDGQDHIR